MANSVQSSSPASRRYRTTIVEMEEVPVVPLTYPEKVTAKWVWEHVPIATTCSLIALVFGAGVTVGNFESVKTLVAWTVQMIVA